MALPRVIRNADFHCVTGWTKFDNKWEGVSFRHIVDLAKLKIDARYATFECLGGYTTSLSIIDLNRDDVVFAYRLDDRELPREHGGPLRLVVPQKYGYKSAKWVFRVEFTAFQELGYWEKRGYSNTANPFTNDRYSTN
jgi:DMSO/TMAO reductase YedYZ molybdopterin-dependent catalytic subunit